MEWQRRPPGGLLPGDPPRRDPRQGPRRPPGAGDARTRIAVGAGHGRRPSTWLKDLDPGRGGGLLEGRRVCARSGQQGRARGVLIVCCDGPAGLPEAARGDLARLHGPHLRGPPRSAPPVRFVAYGDRKGVAAALRPSLHRPRRGGRPTGPRRLPPVRPGPASTPRRRRRGRGPGRGSSPSWPSPRPCAGSPLHHQRDRVAQPPSRAVRREPRPLPLRRGGGRTAVAGGSATSRTAGPRSAPRRRTRPPTRAGPTGGLVEGQVTTNRSAPPAGPPGSPPPTPTESTPTSDRTRLHRNIDRLPRGAPARRRLPRPPAATSSPREVAPDRLLRLFPSATPFHPSLYEKKGRSGGRRSVAEGKGRSRPNRRVPGGRFHGPARRRRRMGDSNPRGLAPNTLSKRAP